MVLLTCRTAAPRRPAVAWQDKEMKSVAKTYREMFALVEELSHVSVQTTECYLRTKQALTMPPTTSQ
jgi:hypothetical protein